MRGLVAGVLPMAAGEFVSVCSQADTEKTGHTRERHESATEARAEEDALSGIYIRRGLEPDLARAVTRQLTAKCAGRPRAANWASLRRYAPRNSRRSRSVRV